MPLNEFLKFSFWAFVGMVGSFSYSVRQSIRKDSATPNRFSWPYLWKGMFRFVSSIFTICASVIFWEQISGWFFESASKVELTAWSAFWIIGVGNDKIVKSLFGETKEAYRTGKQIIKKVNNAQI